MKDNFKFKSKKSCHNCCRYKYVSKFVSYHSSIQPHFLNMKLTFVLLVLSVAGKSAHSNIFI